MAISFVTAASANASSVAISGTQVNDLIFVFAYNGNANTVPTLASGYVSKLTNTGTSEAARLSTRIADGTETSSGTWTNATQVVCAVYRGAYDVGNSANQSATGTTLNYTTISMKVTDGTSWVVGFGGARSATAGMNGNMSVLDTNRTNQTTVNGLDTHTGVSSFGTHQLTVTGSGSWIVFTMELLAASQIVGSASGHATVTGTIKGTGNIVGSSSGHAAVFGVLTAVISTIKSGSWTQAFRDFINKRGVRG